MANRTLLQELSEIRTRVRKLQAKVLNSKHEAEYSWYRKDVLKELVAADSALASGESRMKVFLEGEEG